METILILLVTLITLIIVLGLIYSLWIGYEQWQYMHDPHKMLFLSTSNDAIETKLQDIIAKYCQKTKDYNLVELGCGKAVILKSLAEKYQWKSVVGIEGQKSVWLQAWINCFLLPKLKNLFILKIVEKANKENSPLEGEGTARFPCDILSEGWHAKLDGVDILKEKLKLNNKIQLFNQNIFDYTSKKPTFHYCYLGVKLMKELYEKGKFNESIVVSLDYEIEGIEPTEIIELETKTKIQKKLLVYLFLPYI